MKRAAVLVPTSLGAAEAVVHIPDGSPVAAAVALHGLSGRAGTNRQWARVADALAEIGIVVLRFDYLAFGDGLLEDDGARSAGAVEAIDWFRDRTVGLDLLLCGKCYGARPCLTYAAAHPHLGLALVAPLLRMRHGRQNRLSVHFWQLLARIAARTGVRLPARSRPIDPEMARAVKVIGSAPPPWILIGERDYQWRSWANPNTAPPELASAVIEVVPGIQVHSPRTLAGQNASVEHVAVWAQRTLRKRVES
jgi:hypothetical protein